jgi:hypothetical protein
VLRQDEAHLRMPTTSPRGTALVIFLVHGTFARGAPWARAGSPFGTQLAAALAEAGHANVCFETVDWSGGNSHHARRAGAVRLERRLRASLRSRPGASHFVVGHSHGGNIALRAAKRTGRCADGSIGVVTLATPFLKFRKVRSSMIGWPLLCLGFAKGVALLAITMIAGPVLAFAGFYRAWPRGWPIASGIYVLVLATAAFAVRPLIDAGWPATPGHFLGKACSFVSSESFCAAGGTIFNLLLALMGTAFLFAVAYGVALDEVSWKQRRSLVRQRRAIFRRYAYSQPEPGIRTSVLALSSAIDEALGVLSGTWMAHLAVGWMARTFSIAIVGGATVLAAFVIWRLNRWIFASERSPMVAGFAWEGLDYLLPIGGLIIATAVGVATLLLTKLAGYSNLGLGLANPDHNLLWTVRAQRAPGTGLNALSVRYGLWEVLRGSRGVFLHSRLYTYAPAIGRIAEWMQHESVRRSAVKESDTVCAGNR